MASVAEVSVTVLPSASVDTTSFYKNVLRLELAAVGLQASRPRDYRTGWYPRTRRSGRSASRPVAYVRHDAVCRRVCISCRYRSGWGTAPTP
jgi:hypothetical protein